MHPTFFRSWILLTALVAAELPAAARPRSWSEPQPRDRAVRLVDRLELTTVEGIERAGLRAAELAERPWSGTYWPTHQGGAAARYADPGFPSWSGWPAIESYLERRLAEDGGPIASGTPDPRSPAEKYDRLVGDAEFGLTRAMIAGARRAFEVFGSIPAWFGFCHGWAPAAIAVPRPSRAVIAHAPDGEPILFHPDDVQALVTLLWATGDFDTRIAGARCEEEDIERGRNGRPLDPDCLDTNPATFHLVLANQIGRSARGFVMDEAQGQEVWNQPIFSYSFQYFDPRTGRVVEDPAAGTASRGELWLDPYALHRSPRAAAILGVRARVTFLRETAPSPSRDAGPAGDAVETRSYEYDLELAEDGEIVGGEWRQADHPDFLWVGAPDATPRTLADALLGDSVPVWDSSAGPVPEKWLSAARLGSAWGAPLAAVVAGLVRASATAP